jgi:very-short-patch-repair endonuclease
MNNRLSRRRELRRNATDAERALWSLLRSRQLTDLKVRRQHSVGPYVLDFYCAACKLAVELDGGQHFTPAGKHYDQKRTDYLAAHGVRVLRFSNRDLLTEAAGVLQAIILHCIAPHPNPRPGVAGAREPDPNPALSPSEPPPNPAR